MGTCPFTYFAYGLNIASDLECPELLPGYGAIDVWVRLGAVSDRLDSMDGKGSFYQSSFGQFLLKIKNIARFFVCNGKEIVIDRAPQATDKGIRAFLFGSVFGALLHQRGVLPLHASVIGTRQGAVALAGNSGQGKSTLAAAFYQRGYRVLADDVCAVSLDTEGKPIVLPGCPHLNLCAEAMEKLQITRDESQRNRLGVGNEKYVRSVTKRFLRRSLPLLAIYELNTTYIVHPILSRVAGREKVWLLRDNTFRRSFLAGMGRDEEYMGMVLTMARHIHVARVSRSHRLFLLRELADLVEDDFELYGMNITDGSGT